ncbi:MAG: sulfatase [Vallitalea sp.]|jgi:arylsulfatase A-like enzyme|nr:sulfatase [Vallitalea sp.]
MNVLYIHTHDSGKMISPYGYNIPTPSMMEFAKDSLMFNKAYCISPTCSPSRAALLTGMYPHQVGMLGLSQRGFEMDFSKHLVRFLKNENYHTVLSGIQHEASWYLEHELGAKIIGYDENITNDIKNYEQKDLVKWDMENAESVADWIKNYKSDKPFFMSYGMYATHREYPEKLVEGVNPNYVKVPSNIDDNENTRLDHCKYMTSANWADRCFGKVINQLKISGLYDKTLIIFTTDHGLANPFTKCNLYDSGTNVTLIIRNPHCNMKGKVTDSLVSHIDVFPTICDILGFEKPSYLEGKSFISLFEDEKNIINDYIFSEINFHTSYEPVRAIRNNRYKYIKYYDDYLKINQSNIDSSLTKTFYVENGLSNQRKYKEALYDLYYDPLEKNNLIDVEEYKEIIENLRLRLTNHLVETNDYILDGPIELKKQWKVNKRECIEASSKNKEDYISLGRSK